MTVWIGFLQWHRSNGFPYHHNPILQPLNTIQHKDAILHLTRPEFPAEPDWPKADFIVGNPPFLGGKKMRWGVGDDYVDDSSPHGRSVAPRLICAAIGSRRAASDRTRKCKLAGLLATQGIRGGASRESLKRIKQTGDIFFAMSDRPWVLAGATVHVSMVGFDNGRKPSMTRDVKAVPTINSNLTAHTDITKAKRLTENQLPRSKAP